MARGNRNIVPDPSSDLWDLVLDMDWPRVVQHAKSHPQDADFLDGHYHETPLYLACQHDPPLAALNAVIEAHPESVKIASTEHRDLPIHIACRYQAKKETLEALLKDYPETATRNTKWGWTPIMTLWENKKDDSSDEFWDKVLVILRATARSRLLNSDRLDDIRCTNTNVNRPNYQAPSSSTRAGEDVTDEDGRFLVHAAVSMGAKGCPIEVVSYIMEMYPQQVFQRDHSGHLPLHVLIQKVTWSKHRKRRLKPKEKPILEGLLKAHPQSAREKIHNDHHRYPLHSAVANGHCWSHGVRELFLAAPESLVIRDPCTGLFPFQLAAIPIVEEYCFGIDNLETVYQLLRARPDVIFYLQQVAAKQRAPTAKNSTKRVSRRMLFEEKTSKHNLIETFGERFFGYKFGY